MSPLLLEFMPHAHVRIAGWLLLGSGPSSPFSLSCLLYLLSGHSSSSSLLSLLFSEDQLLEDSEVLPLLLLFSKDFGLSQAAWTLHNLFLLLVNNPG